MSGFSTSLITLETIIAANIMTYPLPNEKTRNGSMIEKDAQIGTIEEIHIDPAAEKRLIRKLDLILSPMMMLIFLVAYLDRSNIGKTFQSRED
jgi:hypothetical protein